MQKLKLAKLFSKILIKLEKSVEFSKEFIELFGIQNILHSSTKLLLICS